MKLPLGSFAALLILILKSNSTTACILPARSSNSIEKYTENFWLNLKKCIVKSGESAEEALKSVQELNRNISSYFVGENMLIKVEDDTKLSNRRKLEYVAGLLKSFSIWFLHSVIDYKEFKYGKIDLKKQQYNQFVHNGLEKFDRVFVRLFDESLFDSMKALYNICKMKKSEQQFFGDFLKNLQYASAQAYTTLNIFREISESQIDETSLKDMTTIIHDTYRQLSIKFQHYSKQLSKEFYLCESSPPDAVAISKAIKLKAFEKYFFTTDQITPGYPRESDPCPKDCRIINNMNIPKKITCNKNNDSYVEEFWKRYKGRNDEVCHLTKKCNNIICPDKGLTDPVLLCLNPTSGGRYQYFLISSYFQDGDKLCSGTEMNLVDGVRNFHQPGGGQYCPVCDCICADNNYYISTAPVVANVSDHKVVVGAKFVLRQNTLYIQILQAGVLPNGNINSSTVSWKPIIEDISNRVKLDWQHMRWIDLSENIVPKGRVVTGLKFEKVNHDLKNDQSKTHRVVLSVYSTKYDFVNGQLKGDDTQVYKPHLPALAQKELQLSGTWLPSEILTFKTSSQRVSKDGEFVALTASGEHGGGQITVPLLDAQEVIPPTLTPLSGVGLIYSALPKFAGYIGLKLVEYDLSLQ